MANTNLNLEPLLGGLTVTLGAIADDANDYAMALATRISSVSGSDPNEKITLPPPNQNKPPVGLQEASEILKAVRRLEERLSEIAEEIGDHDKQKRKRQHDGLRQIWQ